MTRALPQKYIQSMPEPDETLEAMRGTLVGVKKNMEILTGQVKPRGLTAVCWDDLVVLGLVDVNDLPTSGVTAPSGYVSNEVAVGSALALTTNVLKNVCQVTVSAAASYDFYFDLFLQVAAAATVTSGVGNIGDTDAALTSTPLDRLAYLNCPAGGFSGAGGSFGIMHLKVGPARVVVTGPTTLFGNTIMTFSGGILSAYGILRAVRA